MPRRIKNPESPWGKWGGVILAAVCFWPLLFLRYAFTLPLANNGDYDRLSLLFILPWHSTLLTSPDGLPAGWRYFPERFDLIAIALLILIGAGAWGRLVCRGFRVQWDDWLEHLVVSYGLGLSVWSLVTLFLGLAGRLYQPLFATLLTLPIAVEALFTFRERRRNDHAPAAPLDRSPRWLRNLCLAAAALFIVRALLGSMLPPMDFDVREYHLGGPKEWFLDEHVHFLPHNVYTSFPFLTEMLSLSAMVLRDDWFRGALAGKLILATFYPLTALAIFVAGRRLFGATAGLLGMVACATTPWAYRIATIAYAEGGLTCYVILALLACVRAVSREERAPRAWIFITGLFAGSAMACKYPGVVQVVIPLGLALLGATAISVARQKGDRHVLINIPWRKLLITGLVYTAGVSLAVGPWLIKNLVETGNPVYPLMWTILGGDDWNAALNEKWRHAHQAVDFGPATLFAGLKSIAVTNDWQSVLVFAFAPLAFLARDRRAAGYVGLYLAWLLLAWWGFTHRIDRFWVPLLPVVCLLSGLGMNWTHGITFGRDPGLDDFARNGWKWICGTIACLVIIFNYLFITSPLIGNPHVLAELDAASRAVENPNLAFLNKRLPKDAKVLLVGGADVFDARFPLVYNTVFDKNLFEEWFAAPASGIDSHARALRPTPEIREKLRAEGITHIFVNWREILRYRTTYGYTKFLTPDRFNALQERGILKEIETLRIELKKFDKNQQQAAVSHFPTLVDGHGEARTLVTGELYRVKLNHD